MKTQTAYRDGVHRPVGVGGMFLRHHEGAGDVVFRAPRALPCMSRGSTRATRTSCSPSRSSNSRRLIDRFKLVQTDR